jgi:hypothetical protein
MRAKVGKVTADQPDYPMVPVPLISCSAVPEVAAETGVSPEAEVEQWKS